MNRQSRFDAGYRKLGAGALGCPTLCDPMNCSTPGFHVLHYLLSSVQISRSVAPAPSFLYPASNLDWRFISYMILYMF